MATFAPIKFKIVGSTDPPKSSAKKIDNLYINGILISSSFSTDINSLKLNLQDANNKIFKLENDLQNANSSINILENNLQIANSKIYSLETDLTIIKKILNELLDKNIT